jgi:hypothetical protein
MKNDPTVIITPDHRAYARCDASNHIEYVTVSWDHFVRGHLEKDENVLVTSILVPSDRLVSPKRDLGELRFSYNSRTQLVAPVTALQNRYHRLMELQSMRERFRLLATPSAFDARDWGEEDLRPLLNPIYMQELLGYEIEHRAPDDADDGKPILVEFQYLFLSSGYSISAPQLWRPR